MVTAESQHGESLPSNTAHPDDGCTNCIELMGMMNTPLNPYPTYIVTQRFAYTPNFGLVQSVIDANDHETSTTYDGSYTLYPVNVTNDAGHTTHYAYYGLNAAFTPVINDSHNASYAGLLAQVTDPNGLSTHYTYDPFGRLERLFRGWEEQGEAFNKPSAFYRYYDYGSFRLHTQPWMIFTWSKTQDNAVVESTGGTWERQFYDGFGNLIQSQRPHTDWGGSGIPARKWLPICVTTARPTAGTKRPPLCPGLYKGRRKYWGCGIHQKSIQNAAVQPGQNYLAV
ncbi:MAG: RHS repeat protein [Chloroflexi bacterium]|nr:RHS repeat protein [Chloroflexota bacterium]